MMMNRERLSFWVRLVAILLAAIFIISFVFLGVGTNISYNIFDLFGNQNQPQQQDQTPDPEKQIAAAEKDLKKDPKDPEKIKDLAYLYYTAGRYDDAIQVLQDGQKAAPKDEEIPEGEAGEQGGRRLRRLGRGPARQRGGVPSGGPGLRSGWPARRGHPVLQPVPRSRSQRRGSGPGQKEDLRAALRQGGHGQRAALIQVSTEGV
jgi:tetratricopeptide (TPR) repeat protein